MILRFKKKRRIFFKTYFIITLIIFGLSVWQYIFEDSNIWGLLSSFFLLIFSSGMVYYQAGIFSQNKVKAPFGYPSIHYKDIVEVKNFAGDILVKSSKHSLSISTKHVEQTDLKQFIDVLENHTPFQLNLQT